MPAVNETPAESEDISAVFFELCDKLEIGELVTSSNFRLSEVMSAIELAEPKMDVGVGSDKILSLESARENGTFAEDYPLHLAVIDATLSMLVAWLEGSSLASTIWTNILLLECSNVNHKTYTPLVNGINLLVRNIHALVSSVGNLEELPEDFNPQEIFQNTQFPSRDDVVGALRKRSAELTEEGKKLKVKTKRAEEVEIRLAIATRLELVAGFLEILGWLVPPDIEDPNYHQNYSLYTTPKSSLKKDHVNVNENENDNENENENTKSADPTPDCDDVDEICDEEDDLYDDDVEIRFFPNFTSAAVAAERLAKSAQAIHETVKFGRHSPDGVDGDYTWLPCFDQKACIHFIPACFPRSVTIPSRKNAACWLVHCARRIHDLSITTPSSTRDLNHLFYYARTFTLTGCVLTRSLLQICMFPADNHLCGDPHRTLAAPIELSLKQQYEPQIQDKESPVYKDDEAQQLYLRFINYMVKASISVYTSLGCNLSRQRDRLEIAIEELGAMQCHAMKVEERIDEVLVAEGIVEKKEDNISYNSISTFVFHNMVAVIHHYYEIGFRMDLYVPYEFTYIFWFLSEVEAKWMLTTMERSHEIQIKTWKANPLSTSINSRQKDKKRAQEDAVRERLKTNQCGVINQFAIGQICEGLVKATVAMIRMDKIKMPPGGEESEKLRFERRMEPFERLGPPIHVTYEDFKYKSNIQQMYNVDLEYLLDEAAINFQIAAEHIQRLENTGEMNTNLLKVAKANQITCRFLMMKANRERAIQFVFADHPMFPTMKIISAKS